jgi:hypothetical protein
MAWQERLEMGICSLGIFYENHLGNGSTKRTLNVHLLMRRRKSPEQKIFRCYCSSSSSSTSAKMLQGKQRSKTCTTTIHRLCMWYSLLDTSFVSIQATLSISTRVAQCNIEVTTSISSLKIESMGLHHLTINSCFILEDCEDHCH